jgi:alcohol dehydrogenase class IV
MVKPFQFARIPKIVFRNGEIQKLAAHLAGFDSSVGLVTGNKSFIDSPAAIRLLDDLGTRKINIFHFPVAGEPSPEVIDNYAAKATAERIGVVVAIGGGSVLDAGKAIAAMNGIGESVERFLEGVGDLDHPGTRLPFIAVPTTSGTGSEATKNSVISRIGPDGYKKSLRHDNFVPDMALIDPELTISCPRDITAASAMDCFTQLTEAYLSDKPTDYTDALALEGLKCIRDFLLRVVEDGSDTEARAGMSFAALTSGICLANAGLGVVHGFASSVGGMFEIPHGVVCGSLMASANEINVRKLRKSSDNKSTLQKYATMGRLFVSSGEKSDDYYADAFISYLNELTGMLKLPGFAGFGVGEEHVGNICSLTDNKNNPVKLTEEEKAEILRSRLF